MLQTGQISLKLIVAGAWGSRRISGKLPAPFPGEGGRGSLQLSTKDSGRCCYIGAFF